MWQIHLRRLNFELRRIRRLDTRVLIGKAGQKMIGVVLSLILLPVTTLLHLAGFRYVTVFTDRIGHLALEPDCLLKEQAMGHIPRRKWIMLAPPGRVANEHLLSYWEPYFSVVRSRFFCFLIKNMSRWGLMRHDVQHYVRALGTTQTAYRIYAEWGDRPPVLKLNEEDEAWGKRMLAELGVPDGAWFVCLHAREGGFSPIDEELHVHRNCRIENTILAMSVITSGGGWVVRVGDRSMHPLAPSPKVIDYAHHRLKSERFDLVLCARCRFFVGNTSGIAFLSSVFGVPCALANLVPIATLGFGIHDISIQKLLWSNRLKRHLTLREIFASEAANYQYAVLYRAAELVTIENSAEDIRLLVIEMLEKLDGNFVERREDQDLASAVHAMFRMGHLAYGSSATISALFLRSHPELVSPS